MNSRKAVNGSEAETNTESHATNGSSMAHQGPRSAEALLLRCKALQQDIESFREYLKRERKEHTIEMSHYRGVVKSEFKHLERLTQRQKEARESKQGDGPQTDTNCQAHDRAPEDLNDSEVESMDQIVASSNLPFLESVWNAAKSTTGLVALQKRFYYGNAVPKSGAVSRRKAHKSAGDSRAGTVKVGKSLVDVVAKDGSEWIKVSLITNHRMLMDKAREGWGGYSSDEESDSGSDVGSVASDDPDGAIPVVKMSMALLEASKEVRIRTKNPTVRLILPKVIEGKQPEIDKILQRLRSKGISVECTGEAILPRSLDSVVHRMVLDPFTSFTSTVNIDCTILLALVSDFSHSDVETEPWFHTALKRQVELEDKENLLPNMLYPAIRGRNLVCTYEAAKRMREIVATIGTPGEKARTAVLMGDENGLDASARRERLAEWTKFPIPGDLELPVHIIDKASMSIDRLPVVAEKVKEGLSAINQSVFLYGWAADIMTITSNRGVVKQIEGTLDDAAEQEEDWPRIWLCPTARSLVGKEKGRKE